MFVLMILSVCLCTGESRRFSKGFRNRDPTINTAPSTFTRIAVEFQEKDAFAEVFIKGGYTGGNAESCEDKSAASNDPCSIPITHGSPINASEGYLAWADGDQYLDFKGAELGQGLHNGELAHGTPLYPVSAESAVQLTNAMHHKVMHKTTLFWYVELEMDCSNTEGFFEVEIVNPNADSQSTSQNPQRDTDPRERAPIRLNFPKNFDFSKLRSFDRERSSRLRNPTIPAGFNFTERLGNSDRPRAEGKPPKAIGWKANMDTASGPDAKPFPIVGKRTGPPTRESPYNQRTCHGNAPFRYPYVPSNNRFLGRCGYANVFRFNTFFCESNVIPNENA